MSNIGLGSTYQIFTVSSDFMKDNAGHQKLSDFCKENAIPVSIKYEKKPIPAPYLGKGEKIFMTQQFTTPRKFEHSVDMICNNFGVKHIKTKSTGEVSGSIVKQTDFMSKAKDVISRLF